ncbi:MAG: DNA/RNA non-specific endonuclease [Bacteroidales bacterium]|nr:DNA/RNA non-specific endonuclease [Bacteroidales bacterium]
MKSTFVKIGLVAAIALMGFSCGKDKGEVPQEVFTRTVKVSLTKGADTKTSVVEEGDKASYIWTEGDHENLFIYENGVKGEVSGAEYTDNMKKATFTVTFPTSSSATEFKYVAKYTSDVSNSKNPKLNATQNPLPDSYDPTADVMVSDTMTLNTAATSLQFVMHRVVTVNKMTLKGLVPGEKISRVELELDKIVAGYYVESNGSFSGSDKKLSLIFDGMAVPSDGTFPVYFVCAPVADASIQSVVVVTDQNIYTKPASAFSKTISFTKGNMTRFGMDMSGYASPVSTGTTYTLVTESSDLTDGNYIIAASDYNIAMGHLSGTIHTSEEVKKEGNTITLDNTSSVLPLVLTKSGNNWTIKNDDPDDSNFGKYIAWSSGNSSTEQTNSYAWTITVASSGVATIKSATSSDRSLQYNSNQPRFACYTSSQQPVALYKKSGSVYPVGISFEQESFDLIKGTEDYNAFTGQTVTKADTDTRTVTYSISGDGIGSIDSSTGAVTLNGEAGTAIVKATVGADASHSSGSVSYTINVTAAPTEYDLLDNAFIGVTGTNYSSKSNLSGTSGRGSVYATYSAGGTETSGSTIQIRTSDNKSGIITTASGGNVTKVELIWNSATVSGRSVQIYGKNTAYSNTSDLYDSQTQGTLIGELAKGTTTLTFTGNYKYIGIRSKDGAVYVNEIHVYWTDGSPGTDPVINVTSENPVYVAKEGGSQSISYSITNPVSGQSLSASANASSWISNISVGTSTVSFTVAAQAAGSAARSGIITLNYSGASPVQVSVSQEAGEGGSQAANGWLELPAKQTGNDLYNGVFKVGNDRNYSYLYQYSTYTSMWTAYPLYSSTMSSTSSGEAIPGPYNPVQMASDATRGTSWAANPDIEKALQVNVWDGSYNVNLVDPPYVSDYYARGHQIPNADRSGNGSMQTQTYYATNSTPQIQNRFNGYIWGQLETAVRNCVKDTVYVVTGPTFRTVGGSESITYIHPSHDSGKNVPVPNYYWKVLLKVKRSGSTITDAIAIGFWFEHKQYNSQDFTPYVKSVSQIETLTGLDFFVNLPSSLQATAKANTNWDTFRSF